MTTGVRFGGLLLAAAVVTAGSAVGQDVDTKKKQAEMMALYAKASQPGPEHKVLEPIVGKWTFTAKFWFDPSQPAMETKGVAQRKWILGGRFIADEVECPSFEGQAFLGFGLMGFDNVQQKYTSIWLDSMGTAFTTAVGAVDTSGKIFTYHKEEVDSVTKQKSKARDVVKIESKDRHTMEMYKILPDGKEMKVGEIIYSRSK